MKTMCKTKPLVIMTIMELVILLGCNHLLSCCTGKKNASHQLVIKREVIRIGEHDIVESIHRNFNWSYYEGSSLTSIVRTIIDRKSTEPIHVPFGMDIEIEIEYDSLNLKEWEVFKENSEFTIFDPKRNRLDSVIHGGGGRSYKIMSNRAIVTPLSLYQFVDVGDTAVLSLRLLALNRMEYFYNWSIIIEDSPQRRERDKYKY